MAIFETGGHGEPRELVVECRESICVNWESDKRIYPAGFCRKPEVIVITYGGMCNQFKEKEK